jgi:hypothetical protein
MDARVRTRQKKEGKRKMPGWLIALIVVAAQFIAGGICCNTIGKSHGAAQDASQVSSDIDRE